MKKPDDLTDIIENHSKIEKALRELYKKSNGKPADFYIIGNDHPLYQDLIYDVDVIECANNRLLVCIHNKKTDEDIRIDETYEDVKKLYNVLKEYFEKWVWYLNVLFITF